MIRTKEDGSWIRITVSMETSRDRCVHSINSAELCDWIDVGMWGRKESGNNPPQQTKVDIFPLGSLTCRRFYPHSTTNSNPTHSLRTNSQLKHPTCLSQLLKFTMMPFLWTPKGSMVRFPILVFILMISYTIIYFKCMPDRRIL